MSIECAECERDTRGPHDPGCSRYRPDQAACTCDPEWRGDCPSHATARFERINTAWVELEAQRDALAAKAEAGKGPYEWLTLAGLHLASCPGRHLCTCGLGAALARWEAVENG